MNTTFRRRIKKSVKRTFKGPPPPQPDTRVAVWDAHKLIYVRVPKCANTSVMKSIAGAEKRRMWSTEIMTIDPEWTTFSFVRNPWARLVSTYRDKASPDSTSPRMVDGVFQGFVKAGIPVFPNMTFAEFCEVVCAIPDSKTDKHLCSQVSFLIRDQQPIVQTIGRVESLESDWNSIMAEAGLDFEPLHLNKSRHDHYSEYYDDKRLINLVGDRYAEDISRFNYDFL